ncbi:hypothetical protein [Saccharospirillum impatiens]|uniref:hypothetical protein n=1 Tax=Saccharospirillum impatiens TaxID=169438 RepID=UPI0003F4E41B|nr:hypothetical protein [Saccharospirillum impatiens]
MTSQTIDLSLTPDEFQALNKPSDTLEQAPSIAPGVSQSLHPLGFTALSHLGKQLMVRVFTLLFYSLSALLVISGVFQFFTDVIAGERGFMSITVSVVNSLIIGLAMFELGAGISKEYTESDQEENVFTNIRRTITRFLGTVCIALVLESLIMIIKYSQLDLAGNLFYPVAILVGASVLLISLGGFLALTRGHTQ